MADSLRTVRFPNETDEYGDARNELLKAEVDLRRRTEEVAALRRRLPVGGAAAPGSAVQERDPGAGSAATGKLSEAFNGDPDTPLIFSFMYGAARPRPRPTCPA